MNKIFECEKKCRGMIQLFIIDGFTHILTILWYDSTRGMEMWIQVVISFDLAKVQSSYHIISYSSLGVLNIERKMIFKQKAGKAILHAYISDIWMTMADTKRPPASDPSWTKRKTKIIILQKILNIVFQTWMLYICKGEGENNCSIIANHMISIFCIAKLGPKFSSALMS